MPTFSVTDRTFRTEVLESEVPVFVDFWGPSCGPCVMIAPLLEELSDEYEGRVKIAKLNTAENPEITSAYGIVSIPTLNTYVGGELVRSIVGARPKRFLIEEIEALLVGADIES